MLVDLQSYILVHVGDVIARVNTTNCSWCSDKGICSACAAKANQERERLTAESRITH